MRATRLTSEKRSSLGRGHSYRSPCITMSQSPPTLPSPYPLLWPIVGCLFAPPSLHYNAPDVTLSSNLLWAACSRPPSLHYNVPIAPDVTLSSKVTLSSDPSWPAHSRLPPRHYALSLHVITRPPSTPLRALLPCHYKLPIAPNVTLFQLIVACPCVAASLHYNDSIIADVTLTSEPLWPARS